MTTASLDTAVSTSVTVVNSPVASGGREVTPLSQSSSHSSSSTELASAHSSYSETFLSASESPKIEPRENKEKSASPEKPQSVTIRAAVTIDFSQWLEALLINLLLASTIQKTDALTLSVIKHLCSQGMSELVSKKTLLELLLLSNVPSASPAIRTAILGSDLARTSSLLSLLSSLQSDAENFIATLMEKLPVILEPSHVSVIINNNCLLHNTSLVTMMVVMAPQLLTTNKAWARPMVDFLLMTVRRLQVCKSEEDVEGAQNVILNARKLGYIPWRQYKTAVSSLLAADIDSGQCQDIFVSLSVLVVLVIWLSWLLFLLVVGCCGLLLLVVGCCC